MGKSTNGPDWVDVLTYIDALDALHGCVTTVSIIRDTHSPIHDAEVILMSQWDALPGSAEPIVVLTYKHCNFLELRCLAAVVYNGIYGHDIAVGRRYEQLALPEG